MGTYINVFTTFCNVSMIYPILVYLIVGLCSYLCGVCIKAFMAINDKEFRQMNNQW